MNAQPDLSARAAAEWQRLRGTVADQQRVEPDAWPQWARRAGASPLWKLMVTATTSAWALVQSRRAAHLGRSLRVVETVGMGEKRFVAIIQVEDQRFLVGGGSAGMSLLAQLDRGPEFSTVLSQQTTANPQQYSPLSSAGSPSPPSSDREDVTRRDADVTSEGW